jgi:MFS family permease
MPPVQQIDIGLRSPKATVPGPRTRPRRLSHPAAFVAVTAIFVLFAAASSAPSPLYVVYQQEWGFSATTLTVVFAVYVFGLILSLLVLGALSDHVGRRPVLAAAIVLEAAALVLFITAGDVTLLLLARLVQGVATGAALTTLAATVADLNPPHSPGRAGVVNGVAPTSGLALGALGCGALVQFAPAPTHLVYALLLGGMVLACLIVAAVPETSARRPGGLASLAPRLGVPARLRPEAYALVPILVASWALGGLYLSLGPSVAVSIFGLGSHLIGGLVVTLLCGTGAMTAFAVRAWPADRVLRTGAVLLTAGTALTLAGVQLHAVVLAGAAGRASRARRAVRGRLRARLPGLQPARSGGGLRQHGRRPARHGGGLQPRRRRPRPYRASRPARAPRRRCRPTRAAVSYGFGQHPS